MPMSSVLTENKLNNMQHNKSMRRRVYFSTQKSSILLICHIQHIKESHIRFRSHIYPIVKKIVACYSCTISVNYFNLIKTESAKQRKICKRSNLRIFILLEEGMRAIFSIAVVSLLSLGMEVAHSQEQVIATRDFQDWSVFIDSGDCWISSYLESQIVNDKDKFHYLVTFYESEATPRISIVSGSERIIHEIILFSIGNRRFAFSVSNGFAYPLSDDELYIFNSMLDAEPLDIVLNDDRSTFLKAQLSYSGFKDALNYVYDACNIRLDHNIFDRNGISLALSHN
jgi:hypothetical protein